MQHKCLVHFVNECYIVIVIQYAHIVKPRSNNYLHYNYSFGREVDFLYHKAARYSNHTTGIRCSQLEFTNNFFSVSFVNT